MNNDELYELFMDKIKRATNKLDLSRSYADASSMLTVYKLPYIKEAYQKRLNELMDPKKVPTYR